MTLQDHEIVIIGGGPSGLGVSYLLTAHGRTHVVLEQCRIGESWRSRRWDSLRLVARNWTLQFPGRDYQGPDPQGYMSKDDVVAHIEAYARSFAPPVPEGVRAIHVGPGSGGRRFVVETTAGGFQADHVVIATGANRVPRIPAASTELSDHIVQFPAAEYRNPAAVSTGAVLVVGSGESGCQIAEELARDGRHVYLSAGRCWWTPAVYRGHDGSWWNVRMGRWDLSATKDARPSPQATGQDGGRILNLHTLARAGIALLGHLEGADGTRIRFRPDLDAIVEQADERARQTIARIDAFASEQGLGGPPEDAIHDPDFWTHPPTETLLELDLLGAGVTTVIWATGYRLDFGWIDLPAFDTDGYPEHVMGVAAHDGLYFPALPGRDTFPGATRDALMIGKTLIERTGVQSARES